MKTKIFWMKNYKFLNLIFFLSLLTLAFQNCGGVKFAANDSSNKSNQADPGAAGTTPPGGTCSLQSLSVPIKLMFVVDTSGSNVRANMNNGTAECTSASGVTCSPATDPDKTFRGGSIASFFNSFQSKTNFSWGFETFSGDSAVPYIGGGSASFDNAAAMQQAITRFNKETDGGATPYEVAIAGVKTAIANDPDLSSTAALAPLYYVIFMSDGYPSDTLNKDGSVNLNLLDQDIQAVIALAPNRIRFNTVYYGTINDPVASGTLSHMASKGNGQFLNIDTANTKTIAIDDLIQIPNAYCH